MLVVSLYTSSGAVFEKLPAIPRTPTKLRELHRRSPHQRRSWPMIATTKATGQVLPIKASALYNESVIRCFNLRCIGAAVLVCVRVRRYGRRSKTYFILLFCLALLAILASLWVSEIRWRCSRLESAATHLVGNAAAAMAACSYCFR